MAADLRSQEPLLPLSLPPLRVGVVYATRHSWAGAGVGRFVPQTGHRVLPHRQDQDEGWR